MKSQTKLEAYDAIMADGTAHRARDRVLALIEHTPGLSREEIACMLDLRISSVCGRVSELEHEGKVVMIGIKKSAVTGKRVDRIFKRILECEQQKLAI